MDLRTPLCERLGVQLPIVQAPMGSAATSELAAAVSNAGALGMLGVTWMTAAEVEGRVLRTQGLTDQPFGVNVCLDFAIEDQLKAALDAGVAIVSTFWGDPSAVNNLIKSAGAIHLHTVRSPEEGRTVVDAGVDVVVAQGWEAGGHVYSTTATLPLVPAVVDMVSPAPVIAAGGIADGRGVAAALVLGAQAAWLGTRFLTATEASTHDDFRADLLRAGVTDTTYTTCFDGGWPRAPHRVLRNETLRRWEAAGRPEGPDRPGEGDVIATDTSGREFRRYDDMPPLRSLQGDVHEMALYAGQSVGLVHDIAPAREIVRSLAEQARSAIKRFSVE